MEEIDKRIKTLFDHWVNLKTQTMEFNILFNENKEDIKRNELLLLDFFLDLNDLYWGRFLISIARLLDPHKQGKFTNLTLFTLPEILKEKNIIAWEDLHKDVQKLEKKFEEVITYRRKNLAHFDSDFTTGRKSFNTSTHIDDVQSFLNEMINLINKTLTLLGLPTKSETVIYPGRFKGARVLTNILDKSYKG